VLTTNQPQTAYYFCRVHPAAENVILEFCVANSNDPDQVVETLAIENEGGEIFQKWEKRWEGDLLVFKAPDGYVAGAIGWYYDNSRQRGEHAPWKVLESELLRNRKSLIVNGFKNESA